MEAVIEQAQKLVHEYPEAFTVLNIMGATNKGLGMAKEALGAFRKVSELDPYFADGFNNLVVALKDQGKPEEAITIITFNL